MPADFVHEPATWGEFPAHRLANAHLEVVIVPALGRVMHFSRAGAPRNELWTDTLRREGDAYVSPLGWANWGGDKTWLAPQARWSEIGAPAYMGDPAWGEPLHGEHTAAPLPDGGLRVTGPLSIFSGLRVSRDYHLDGDELVILQRVENISAPRPHRLACWPVTNVPRPDCFYALPSPTSPYPEGVFRMVRMESADTIPLGRAGPFVTYRPANRRPIKFGLDSDHAALASRRGGEIFIQRAERPPGDYPDVPRHDPALPGMCAEYFDTGSHARGDRPYAELELLGPLVNLAPGETTTHCVRWSLLALPSPDTELDPAQLEQLAARLRAPVARIAPGAP
ncbi:MAG: hypothetical protein H7067_11710, partial [Burkholderiales bacterium]|nr:hypothetical protein [Opitutaceae bacterium]